MITVQDILEIPELNLKLLAGGKSTSNPVRWVHISEVPDPTKWLKGGELLLTTGYSFVGDEEQQVSQIKRLIDHNISGLGFGTGFSYDKVPPALVNVAQEYDFPLFEVPYHVPFIAITEAVASKIVNEQYSLLQRSLAVHEKLTEIVLEEKGLEAILSTLSALVGCSAVLLDFHGVVLCEAAYRRHLGAELIADLWRMISDRRADRQNFALTLEGVAYRRAGLPGGRVAPHRRVPRGGQGQRRLQRVTTASSAVQRRHRHGAGAGQEEGGGRDREAARRRLFTNSSPATSTRRRFRPPARVLRTRPAVAAPHRARRHRRGRRRRRRRRRRADVKERLHWTVDEFMARRDVLGISASRSDSVVVLVQPGKMDAPEVIGLAGEFRRSSTR